MTTSLELAERLRAKFPALISAPAEFRGEITLHVSDPEAIPEVCAVAKKRARL